MKAMTFIVVALLSFRTHSVEAQQNKSEAESKARTESPDDRSKAVTIPLDRIWAYSMKGTRDILKLEKKQFQLTGESLLDAILIALIDSEAFVRQGEVAGPGFAVAGRDLAALRGAHAVLVEGKKPQESFSPNDEISLVFFVYGFTGHYVHLQKVERRGNRVELQYGGERYFEKHRSPRLALIPLGKLANGKYRVEMVLDKKFVDKGSKASEGWSTVCKTFSFIVKDDK
jgi:hypothetical protein